MFKKLFWRKCHGNLDDADLPTAAKGAARAAFTNSGQVCLCGSRILIDSKIYDEFMPLLIKEVKAMKVGNPAEENTDIGSVISHPHMKKVLSYIDLAKQEGGKIATGGGRIILPEPNSNGAFIEPTIVEGLYRFDVRPRRFLCLLLLSINQ